jgi:hypothetical protein
MKDIESRAKERALIDCGTIVAGIGDVSKARFNWMMNSVMCTLLWRRMVLDTPTGQKKAFICRGMGMGIYEN